MYTHCIWVYTRFFFSLNRMLARSFSAVNIAKEIRLVSARVDQFSCTIAKQGTGELFANLIRVSLTETSKGSTMNTGFNGGRDSVCFVLAFPLFLGWRQTIFTREGELEKHINLIKANAISPETWYFKEKKSGEIWFLDIITKQRKSMEIITNTLFHVLKCM